MACYGDGFTFCFSNFFAWSPLWPSAQSSWLQIQRSGFDSRRYQIFWEVVGLERGQLSLVNTTEELLGRKCSASGLESRECGRRDPSCWPRGTLYPQKFALTSSTSGSRSVGIVCSRTRATELVVCVLTPSHIRKETFPKDTQVRVSLQLVLLYFQGIFELWLYLSAAVFPCTGSVNDHKFQFVVIIVNVCSLISSVYGICMTSCGKVSKPSVGELVTAMGYNLTDSFLTRISRYEISTICFHQAFPV
jgi:hypothetical protein